MQSTVKILGEDYAIECAECDTRRLEDLAKLLEQRLQGFSGDVSAMRRLVLTALGLIDEAQATSAARRTPLEPRRPPLWARRRTPRTPAD